ncbi:hypothetical protein JK635_02225 [Neobacillus sp. YIM B02564]|uniref:Uncharacterized protein n=1 Tax=Neobacillus paridis TaxID=2803862 RepID=A0ABS1TL88_9BACI|nr:hypothetical protein [Neobacillus paridis]MBL4951056.1 hypothetical protein [Neobacillus paridis]
MSVNQKHYVMVGIDLTRKVKQMNADELDIYFEEMEEFADNKKLSFVFDSMSGEYCFLGELINEGDEYEGMSPKVQHFASDLFYIRKDVERKISKISTTSPSLISFTHWC